MTRRRVQWDATSVRGLRRHMQLTQEQLAEALGVRQQTVSEWETGLHTPRGASGRLLSIVADQHEFAYEASPHAAAGDDTARNDDVAPPAAVDDDPAGGLDQVHRDHAGDRETRGAR